jgi:hypothetical protein
MTLQKHNIVMTATMKRDRLMHNFHSMEIILTSLITPSEL